MITAIPHSAEPLPSWLQQLMGFFPPQKARSILEHEGSEKEFAGEDGAGKGRRGEEKWKVFQKIPFLQMQDAKMCGILFLQLWNNALKGAKKQISGAGRRKIREERS